MKYLLLTFDLEELVFPKENNIPFPEEDAFKISEEGLKKILRLLDNRKIKSTFFTTFEFAQKFPEQIRTIVRNRHELAFHGKFHKDYIQVEGQKMIEEFKECKNNLEKKFKTKVSGFRAPRFGPVGFSVLEKCGFIYDSSVHPTILPFTKNSFADTKLKKYEKIIEICPSVSSLRLPISWIFFRLLPLQYSISCTKDILRHSDYVMLYFHPWDFYELERIHFKGFYWKVYKKNSGKKLIDKIDKYLDFADKNDMRKTTIKEYLKTKTI